MVWYSWFTSSSLALSPEDDPLEDPSSEVEVVAGDEFFKPRFNSKTESAGVVVDIEDPGGLIERGPDETTLAPGWGLGILLGYPGGPPW